MRPDTPAPRSPFLSAARRRGLCAIGLCLIASSTTFRGTPEAIAIGETRTLTFVHQHTKESATVTFKRWGSYDYSALDQLNWLLRDWRRDEKTRMNPKLFDVIWEAAHEAGSSGTVHVNSAYRSPSTNAMLRRRSRAVAKHSQHMNGNAMDFVLPDVSMSRVREVAMRMQRGGVGYYPNANTPFVHLDVGSVRSWPRMTRDQLARLFPDEMTVHLPAGGGAMAGYEQAKTMIIARGGTVGGYSDDEETEGGWGGGGFLAALFGGSGRGNGGSPVQSGDDAGMRSFAMNNGRTGPAAGGASVAVASAASAPRSIRGRRGAQPATQVAAASVPGPFVSLYASESSPIAGARGATPGSPRVQVAVAAPARPDAKPAEPRPPVFVSLPVPPRRPNDLPVVQVASLSAPLPPTRPADIVVASAQTAATAVDALGAVVGRGDAPPARPAPPPTQIAAYAPVEAPMPPARPAIRPGVGTTPVGASAGAMPAANGVATTRTKTLPAPVAARVAMAPVDQILMEFRRKADVGPSAGVFAGPAVKPVMQLRLSAAQR